MGDAGIVEEKARDAMRPAEQAVHMSDTADEALDKMNEHGLSFLPVVAPETRKFLGIVLKRALINGCMRMGHRTNECRIQKHVKEDVDFCTLDERLDRDWMRADEGTILVVVDEDHRPVGYIER